ncbi:uncharacterized protein LOC126971869 isoform X1 [Leptidea sinapis]|uniref:uncharacterized protein LOC126971869 isoform X1 n=1 Tax=Leptidea sinapis TaxID=189913 RepID=UPI0021C30033|nr:uncharacterized protein LOC126971869 isoform X1 [Leptidea sinapis]
MSTTSLRCRHPTYSDGLELVIGPSCGGTSYAASSAKEWQRNDTPKANSRREKREEPSSETESSENDDVKNEESKNAEGDEDKDEKEDAEEGEEKKEEKPCEESIYVYQVPLAIEYMEPEVYLEEF